MPLTIKDAIWLRVGQAVYQIQQAEHEMQKQEFITKGFEGLYLCLADIRAIALDTNAYTRLTAHAHSKNPKVKLLQADALPSVAIENERKENEKLSKMTPEERELYLFQSGKKVRY